MKSNLFKVNARDLAGAVLSAVIVALLTYVTSLTSIWSVNFKQVLDIALLAGVGSILKALGTNSQGAFMGSIPVK